MVKKKESLPQEGDLVIVTISKVFGHGAFAKLDEYEGREGYIHISEVASTWIKNIRDFVKKGQKTVAKVLSVDPKKGHIDISLRRVSEALRKNKMQEWKRAQKAEKLLEITGEKIGTNLESAYEEVGFPLENKYGEIYIGLEEISAYGEKVLKEINIPKKWRETLTEIAKENVVIPRVKISGYLDLECPTYNGVETIKAALNETQNLKVDEDVELQIFYVGSPRYRIDIKAPEYKIAENVLKKAADTAIKHVSSQGGKGNFYREIKEEAKA